MTVRVEHEPHGNDDPTKRTSAVRYGVEKDKETRMMFMNFRSKDCKLVGVNTQERRNETQKKARRGDRGLTTR